MKEKILSICIPTNGREDILKNTLDSIFAQNVNSELYEVCIADNANSNNTQNMIDEYYSECLNIRYKKNNSQGYLNTIEALRLGNGKFLKLNNNYSSFRDGKLQKIIDDILKVEKSSQLFFLHEKNRKDMKIVDSFESFFSEAHYYTSWSTAFGMWKKDFDEIEKENIQYDLMFPHFSLLVNTSQKEKYIILRDDYYLNQKITKKGGYNLPEVFGNGFLNLVKELHNKKKISNNTFNKIKTKLLLFVSYWNSLSVFDRSLSSYDFSDYNSILRKNYSGVEMKIYEIYKNLYLFRLRITKIIKTNILGHDK